MVTCSSREFFCRNPQDLSDGCEQGGRDLSAAGQLPPEDGFRGDVPASGGQQVCELADLEIPLHAQLFQAWPAEPPIRIGDESQRERQRVSFQRRQCVVLGGLPCGIQQLPGGARLPLLRRGKAPQRRRLRTDA
jgi:hypothetical protein